LASQSGRSVATIRRILEYWLGHPPEGKRDLATYRHVIFDGTHLKRRRGVFAVMDAQSHQLLVGAYDVSEGPHDLLRFCADLKERGLVPRSATVDGNPHLLRVLHRLWPKITIQRCLVHIQRQGLSWCRRQPKRTDAKRLRDLFLQVMAIRTTAERKRFLSQLAQWEHRYGHPIAFTPESGWIFSDLKRARSMLMVALPDMFHYLKDANIPTSTNSLEGYFGRLKQKYRQHRGLAQRHREAFFRWYFHLCPR